jgi:hypothetical protein
MDVRLVMAVLAALLAGAAALGAWRLLRASQGGGLTELARLRLRVERARVRVRFSRWRGRVPAATADTLIARLDELGHDLAQVAE